MKGKRGGLLQQMLVHIILIAILFGLFFIATAEKINARGLKQQVVEKQIALLIEAASPGMSFEINKIKEDGYIDDLKVEEGRVYVKINGLNSVKGYPFSSPYNVFVIKRELKFRVVINE